MNADFAEVVGNESTLTDKNLYAYCDNNPIMRVDEDGEFWNIAIGVGAGAVREAVKAGIQAIPGIAKGVIPSLSKSYINLTKRMIERYAS